MTFDQDKRPQDEHWWLSPGGGYCSFCAGALHADALAYCIACDRPVCHVCVEEGADSANLLCPECGPNTTSQT